MKNSLLPGFALALLLLSQHGWAQAPKKKESFPSYNQIRPKAGEMTNYDYVRSDGRVEYHSVDLFDYPAGTVTYLVNGKPTTSMKQVRRVMSDKRNQIDSIAISSPDAAGKRIIRIRYERP